MKRQGRARDPLGALVASRRVSRRFTAGADAARSGAARRAMGAPLSLRHKANWIAQEEAARRRSSAEKVTKKPAPGTGRNVIGRARCVQTAIKLACELARDRTHLET